MPTCDRCGAEQPPIELENRQTFLFCRDRGGCDARVSGRENAAWTAQVRAAAEETIRAREIELFDAEERIRHLEALLAQATQDIAEARTLAGHLTCWISPLKRTAYEKEYPWLNKKERR